MVLKFSFILCLSISVLENFTAFKLSSHSLLADKDHQPFTDSTANALNSSQKDISSTSLKTQENALDCSSGSWNSSPNCTESPRTLSVGKAIDVNREKEITLPHGDPTSVNPPITTKNIVSKAIKTEPGSESPPKTIIGIESTKMAPRKAWTRTAKRSPDKNPKIGDNESIQSVLERIFPVLSDDEPDRRTNLTFPDGRGKHKNRNSSERRNKPAEFQNKIHLTSDEGEEAPTTSANVQSLKTKRETAPIEYADEEETPFAFSFGTIPTKPAKYAKEVETPFTLFLRKRGTTKAGFKSSTMSATTEKPERTKSHLPFLHRQKLVPLADSKKEFKEYAKSLSEKPKTKTETQAKFQKKGTFSRISESELAELYNAMERQTTVSLIHYHYVYHFVDVGKVPTSSS